MTVLVREELNDADLAWAAADLVTANVMAEALRVQAMLAAAPSPGTAPGHDPCPAGFLAHVAVAMLP